LQRGESYWAWCARSMANVKKLRGLDEGTKRTPKANSVDVTFRAFSFEQKCYSDQRCRCFVGRASGDQFPLDSIAYNCRPFTAKTGRIYWLISGFTFYGFESYRWQRKQLSVPLVSEPTVMDGRHCTMRHQKPR